MAHRTVITGQRIDPAKLEEAQRLRRDQTPAEKRLWAQLRAGRLHGFHFRRQQVIAGFIVDFYCHAAGLVVEVDGGVHEGQEAYDAERDQALAEHGLYVLRISHDAVVHHLTGVLDQIAALVTERVNLSPGPFPQGKGSTDGAGPPPCREGVRGRSGARGRSNPLPCREGVRGRSQ